MKSNNGKKVTKNHQTGISLIELMIAMVLGLLIIAGVIHFFASSQQIYRMQEAMSRIQESGRYATDMLSRNIRQAGYKGGCGKSIEINNLLDETHDDYDETIHTLGVGIEGWDNASPSKYTDEMTGYVAKTDVILVKSAATLSGLTADGNTPSNAASIALLQSNSGVAQGQIIMVAEDDSCDLFQNLANDKADVITRAAGNTNSSVPGNKSPAADYPFSKSYSDTMRIMLFTSDLYYLGVSDADSNITALRRIRYSNTGSGSGQDQELVDNITDMQIRYGVDSNGNKRVNAYVTANNVDNWDEVIAVRVSLLARSEHNNILSDPIKNIPFNGSSFNAAEGDLRMYQAFTTTVGIRNKLP